MSDKSKWEKTRKRRLPQQQTVSAACVPNANGIGLAEPPPQQTANQDSGAVAPQMGRNLNLIKKALHLQPNYEAYAAKQMMNYKYSKAKEMFKERNMKFTTVLPTSSNTSGQPSSTAVPCPVDILDPRELEAIRTYEESIRPTLISSRSPGINSPNIVSGAGTGIPPPPLPSKQPQKEIKRDITPTPAEPANVVALASPQKEIKHEIYDEIPSFNQTGPSTSTANVSHSEQTFVENEEEKKKLILLWSLVEEELTVDSSLEKGSQRIVELQKHIEILTKTLSSEEKSHEMLQKRKEQIVEKKKKLIRGANGEKGKKKD